MLKEHKNNSRLFSSFFNLKSLTLSSNQLTTFDGPGMPDLEILDIYHNELKIFDGSGLPKLKRLILTENQLESFDGSEMPNLVSLLLTGNNLRMDKITNIEPTKTKITL